VHARQGEQAADNVISDLWRRVGVAQGLAQIMRPVSCASQRVRPWHAP
jgi:hypothetical protein